jgi:hypothetical protein
MPAYSALEKIFREEVLPQRLHVRFDVPMAELIPTRERLRLDFVIVYKGRVIAFEIDGHQSHFDNPKQINRDVRKDNLCKKHGIALHRILPSLVLRRSACKRTVKRLIYGGSKR